MSDAGTRAPVGLSPGAARDPRCLAAPLRVYSDGGAPTGLSSGSEVTMFRSVAFAALLAAVAQPALANDSTAELGLGGLTLTKSDAIVMQSEDLFISEEKVTVDYVFLNTSAADIETVVAFPLPDIENGIEKPAYDFTGELGFRTLVDGKPADLTLTQTAVLKGRDVTERLKAAKIPLMPIWEKFDAAVKALPTAERNALIAEGLLMDDGSTPPSWAPLWTTKTAVSRTQVFPAGRPVRVSHAYKPFVGGSVGSILKKDLRTVKDFAGDVAAYRAKFCIDDDFVRGFDAGVTKKDSYRPDLWIAYVLTSGANWKGPIGDFRMVIDKGDPKNLVSFCGTGVKKIAPTRFEVRYQNFTPTRDVNVLIVKPTITY